MIDKLTLAETERLVDEAASRIRNILDKLVRDTGLTLDPDIDATESVHGGQFFVVRLNAKVGGKWYIEGVGE